MKITERMPRLYLAEEFRLPSFYRDIFIEMMVSCFLLLFVTFALTTLNADLYKPSTTHIGLMVGFVIYLLIEGYGHLSGAHMNPIVSFAFCLDARITCARAFFYTISQCIGGTLGSGIVYGLSPREIREKLHPFTPAPLIGVSECLAIEAIFTFNLIYTGLSTSDKRTHNVMLPSLPTAFCVGTAIMAVGTWTGACLNPIVSLGPAVVTRDFSYHWVYWVAHYIGGLLAVAVYKAYLYWNKTSENSPSAGKDESIDKTAQNERLQEETSQFIEKILSLMPSDGYREKLDTINEKINNRGQVIEECTL